MKKIFIGNKNIKELNCNGIKFYNNNDIYYDNSFYYIMKINITSLNNSSIELRTDTNFNIPSNIEDIYTTWGRWNNR